MPGDTVQIGPILVSKAVFDAFAVLLGVIVGGLITYLTTRAIEAQKWEQQKKDKRQEQYREALAIALDWIRPIESALIQIESISSSYIWKNISRDQLQKRWPNLLSVLGKIDRAIPTRLQVLLPPAAYDGTQIVAQIDDLYHYLLNTGLSDEHISIESLTARITGVADRILAIKKLTADYRKLLIDDYQSTFK